MTTSLKLDAIHAINLFKFIFKNLIKKEKKNDDDKL